MPLRGHFGWENGCGVYLALRERQASTYNRRMLSYTSGRRTVKQSSLVLALCLGSLFLASCSSAKVSLEAPQGLTVIPGETKIDLSWEDRSNNEAGFAIYRKLESESSFSKIEQTAANTESYTDATVNFANNYLYEVRAFATDGSESEPSISEAVSATKLAAPTNLSALAGENKIDLNWADNSSIEEGFRIFRKLESETAFPTEPLVSLGTDITTYSDTSTTPGTSYIYQVVAFSGGSVSEASNSSTPVSPTSPTNPNPNPNPPVVDTLAGEWSGTVQGIGNVELSVDADLDSGNAQRNNARFTYLNDDGTKFIFECSGDGTTFRCTEFDLGTGEDLGDKGNVLTGTFTAKGKISGSFKPFGQPSKTLTLERVTPTPAPTPTPTPTPQPVTDTLAGEWTGTLQDIGNVELSVDDDLDPGNAQRNNARFTYLNDDQTRFLFECNGDGKTFKCTEVDGSGDSGNFITGTFTAKGKISANFKPFNQTATKPLTLSRK
jgi:hypothetical protein